MKTKCNKRHLLLWVLAACGCWGTGSVDAAEAIWDGGGADDDWYTAANWVGDALPVAGDNTLQNGSVTYSSGDSPNLRAIRVGSGGVGSMDISGGTLTATFQSSWDSFVGTGAGGDGTLVQNGGDVVLNQLQVGRESATGSYTLHDGSLLVARERLGHSLYLGTDHSKTSAGNGSMTIDGGSFTTRAGVYLGSTTGGIGSFTVNGSGASIGIGSHIALDGEWFQNAGSTLSVRIDTTAAGISRIFIDEVGNDGGGDVTFASGALLDVGFTGAFTNGGTFTVMEWEGTLTDNGLQFAPGVDTNIWSFNLDAGNKKLEVIAAGAPLVVSALVHPGITHKLSDLERMKYMVEAQIDPWFSSYQEMATDSKSSYDYVVRGDPSFTELGRDSGVNYSAWNSDIRAAYYNAIRWYISGDPRHADKAIEIFNAWKNLTSVTSGGTDSLSGGVGYIMIEAAELIKSTYSGWSTSDIDAFKAMLVYPGYSTSSEPSGDTTFYWMSFQGDAGRHGNQGLSGWRTVMAMGIFLDNEIMFDRALRYIQGLPHRPDDLPYPTGPSTHVSLQSSTAYADTWSNSRGSSIADYGFNEVMTNYIYANGQCQESSRDQQHTFFGVGLLCSMAEMAWNQGADLYSHENDRLLLGLEYNMRYNVSDIQSYPDQTSPWEPTVASGEFLEGFDRTHRWYSKAISPDGRGDFSGIRPVFEMPVAHFLGRGFKTEAEVKWILRARDKAIELSGNEVAGWTNDAIGWGGLSARRPDYCYGDPISGFLFNGLPAFGMNVVPCTIEAENYDHFSVPGEGHTYHDLTAMNSGGAYRSSDGVDITTCSEGGYALTSMEVGEWVTYTVAVPFTTTYEIALRYAASAAGGKIKVSFGGTDKTSEITLPFGAPYSAGLTDWQDYIIATDVPLDKGVQSMKISFSGVSDAFELNKLSIIRVGEASMLGYAVTSSKSSTAPVVSSSDLAQTQFLSSSATGSDEAATQHAQLFNGAIGNEDGDASDSGEVRMSTDNTITVTFNTSLNTLGYDLTGINTYFGWNTASGGRANQGYEIILTFVDDSTASLAGPAHWEPNSPAFFWTTVSFTGGPSGLMASGVKAVTFDITHAANPGGFLVGREFDIFGVPTVSPAAYTPELTSNGSVSNGTLFTQLSGTLGQNYRLEWTENLTHPNPWQVMTNFYPLTTSPLDLSFPLPNDAIFYRARRLP